jgi:hypothetical protein
MALSLSVVGRLDLASQLPGENRKGFFTVHHL